MHWSGRTGGIIKLPEINLSEQLIAIIYWYIFFMFISEVRSSADLFSCILYFLSIRKRIYIYFHVARCVALEGIKWPGRFYPLEESLGDTRYISNNAQLRRRGESMQGTAAVIFSISCWCLSSTTGWYFPYYRTSISPSTIVLSLSSTARENRGYI